MIENKRREYKGTTLDAYAVYGNLKGLTDKEIILGCDTGAYDGKVVRFSNKEARVHVYKS